MPPISKQYPRPLLFAVTAAVTAAAVTSTTLVAVNTAATTTPEPFRVGNFTPPVCIEETVPKIGFLELQIQALPVHALQDRKWILEE